MYLLNKNEINGLQTIVCPKKREEDQTCLLYKEYARYADTQCILSDAASS